jgi:hypothetical protein
MEHYDVVIATPGSTLEAAYVKSLVLTLEECSKKGISFKWLNGYSSLVHHARELTISNSEFNQLSLEDTAPMGGKISYNKIIWIDSDISWTPEQFFKLYNSSHQVVSGAYLLLDGITTSVQTSEYLNGIPKEVIKSMKEITQVQSIGFGFVAISSGVFEKMERPWFAHILQVMTNSRGEKIPDALGEDISWCVRAHRAGIPIYLDPSVLVTHTKKVNLIWEYPV